MTEISTIVGLVAAFVGGFLCGANNPMFIKKRIAPELAVLKSKAESLPADIKAMVEEIIKKVKD